ncbi:MarR family transcriptional regulator [Leucobacter sp. wl10]|nr:MarR family transcriptional regulator [Leucobacter sp. wl10]
MPSETSGPEALGLLVKETQAILNQRMNETLRPLGLTVPQYACLTALRDTAGINASDLARRAFVSRQSMNVLLQGLDERGLVARAVEPGRKGERTAQLTAEAIALLDRARPAVAAVVDRMTSGLTRSDVSRTHEILARCRDALLAPSP